MHLGIFPISSLANYLIVLNIMNKEKMNKGIAVTAAVVIVFAFLLVAGVVDLSGIGIGGDSSVASLGEVDPNSGVLVEDVTVGEGEEVVAEMLITVHYTGALEDGTVFDSSVQRDEPFEFVYGAGQLIPGFEMGMQGMKVGGKRLMRVPAELAYGDQEIGGIPAGSALIFEVEVLGVEEVVE